MQPDNIIGALEHAVKQNMTIQLRPDACALLLDHLNSITISKNEAVLEIQRLSKLARVHQHAADDLMPAAPASSEK